MFASNCNFLIQNFNKPKSVLHSYSKKKKTSITAQLTDIFSVNRAEVSQKAAEVDALNDQLTEERKRSRDLQWAMEKERCRTGRNEESKREELEVKAFRRGALQCSLQFFAK